MVDADSMMEEEEIYHEEVKINYLYDGYTGYLYLNVTSTEPSWLTVMKVRRFLKNYYGEKTQRGRREYLIVHRQRLQSIWSSFGVEWPMKNG